MKPLDIQPIGHELAIRWEDGSESYIPLEKLRRACPCVCVCVQVHACLVVRGVGAGG